MNLRIFFKVLMIQMGFIVDPTIDPIFAYRKRKSTLLTVTAVIIYIPLMNHFFGSACLFYGILGIPCPACGSTRAVSALLRGDFSGALKLHPLILLSLIIILTAIICGFRKTFRRLTGVDPPLRDEQQLKFRQQLLMITLIVILLLYVIVYIYRMLLYFPHTYPFTYNMHSLWGQLYSFLH